MLLSSLTTKAACVAQETADGFILTRLRLAHADVAAVGGLFERDMHREGITQLFDVGDGKDQLEVVLHGVDGRPGVTLVEYLRISIAWGGCPGWSFAPAARVPAALEALRRAPDF